MTTFKGNRKYPNAATVTEDPRTHTLALQQVIEALNVGQRRTRDIDNSFVRLHELVDVGLIEIVNGQLKLTNAGAAAVSAGATALADLTDVNLTGLSDGDILVYDSGTSKWVASPLSAAAAMNDLTDVDTTGVADGDVLVYDGGTSTWIPGGSGGIATPLTYEEVPHPDAPPVTPETQDDEFNGTTFNTNKWAWRNQGSATATVGEGCLTLTAAQTASANLRIIEQAASGNWKYRAKFNTARAGDNYTLGGLVLVDSVSGKCMTFGVEDDASGTHYIVSRWNSVTSFSTNISSQDVRSLYGGQRQPKYYEIESDGTTLYFRISADGKEFSSFYSETIAAFIGAVDRVGLYIYDASNDTTPAKLVVDWFRKIGGSYAPGTFAANLSGDMATADALNVTYDNVASGLAATNVQDAIDELAASATETESFVYKTSDTDRSNTTTLANDPHLVTTLEANTVYEFEVYLVYTSNTGGAIKWSPNFTGTTSLIKWTSEQGHNNTTSYGSIHTVYYSGTWDAEPASPNTPGWSSGFGSFTGYGRIRGLISVGATGGTFSLQWAQNTSNATASTMRSGSFMRVRRADQMALITAGPPIGDLKHYAVAFDTDFMQGMFGTNASFTQGGSSVSDTAVFITDHPGILRVASNSGTTASGSAVWQFGSDSVFTGLSSAGRMLPPAAPDYLDFEAVLRVNDVVPANVSEWQIGFLDFSGESGACRAMVRGKNLVLDFVTDINGTGLTSTDITASAPTDDSWFRVKIRVNSTEALCYINGVLRATHTTNLPTTSKRLRPGAFATNNLISISPAIIVDVDAMRVTQTYTVGRSG